MNLTAILAPSPLKQTARRSNGKIQDSPGQGEHHLLNNNNAISWLQLFYLISHTNTKKAS